MRHKSRPGMVIEIDDLYMHLAMELLEHYLAVRPALGSCAERVWKFKFSVFKIWIDIKIIRQIYYWVDFPST